MPIGPFPDMEACIAHFNEDPDVSDPGAFCAWMEQEEREGKITRGDKVIWGAEVEFMSLVSTPAVTDSEFLMIKEKAKDPSKIMVKGTIPLLRCKGLIDDENRIVYAPALIPDKADGNREAISKDEIKKAAIKYMEMYRKVDNEHTFMDGDGIPIFSWPLQEDQTFTTMDGKEKVYPEGTWMVGVKVTNDEVWEMVKSGERTGFSIAGEWKVLEIKSKGPGGHTPDGTGPHGRGEGPGSGRGDGSGKEDDEDDEESKSSSEKERSKTEVTDMEPEDVKQIVKECLAEHEKEKAKETSQKEAEAENQKLKDDLAKAMKELEELRKKSDETPAPKEGEKEEKEEKKEDDEEEDDEDEKGEYTDDDEMDNDEDDDDKKKVAQKATKSYDPKTPKEAREKGDPKNDKQSKGIKNAKITVIREPLGDAVGRRSRS